MNVDSDEFVLETIFNRWVLALFLFFLFLLFCLLDWIGLFFLFLFFFFLYLLLTRRFFLFLLFGSLLAHYMVVGVWLKIQNLREVKERVQFVLLEGVEVKHNSLKMEDQHVRSLCDKHTLFHVSSFLASSTLIVTDILR